VRGYSLCEGSAGVAEQAEHQANVCGAGGARPGVEPEDAQKPQVAGGYRGW
jgi:hypothetical protein